MRDPSQISGSKVIVRKLMAVVMLSLIAVIRIARLATFLAKLKSQRDHLRPSATTDRCGRRPQHFLGHREAIHGRRPP